MPDSDDEGGHTMATRIHARAAADLAAQEAEAYVGLADFLRETLELDLQRRLDAPCAKRLLWIARLG